MSEPAAWLFQWFVRRRPRSVARAARGKLAIAALLLVLSPAAARATAQSPATSSAPDQKLPPLSGSSAQPTSRGRLGPGETTSIKVNLPRGEFVRATVSADSGALRARLLGPRGEPLQVTWAWSFFVSLPLAMEAPESGEYLIELSVPPSLSWVKDAPYRIQIDRETAVVRATQRGKLRDDARVDYLRASAHRVRSIDPTDVDYTDLAWLGESLDGVRVVMLGEGDHGGGSDLLAQTRLIQYLHECRGYDVVAFESGLHSTVAAWGALQTGANPTEAFLQGVFAVWGRAEQARFLINYLAAQARTSRPLELAGFDCQLTGTAAPELLSEFQRFLRQRAVASLFTDEREVPTRVLGRLLQGAFRERSSLPPPAEQAQTVEAMRTTAAELDGRESDRDAAFWAQVLRSTAMQLDGQMNLLRGGVQEHAYMNARDHQMAENLLFLVNRMHPGRKVIVVAHTAHVMRSPQSTNEGRNRGFTMGEGVWQALGPQSFTIGFTSYNGATHWVTQPDDIDQDVIPAQRSLFEFESMMDAAGHRLAFVNLRTPRHNGDWLRARFTASALYLVPEETNWGNVLDGLFYIHTQEPRRPVPPPSAQPAAVKRTDGQKSATPP